MTHLEDYHIPESYTITLGWAGVPMRFIDFTISVLDWLYNVVGLLPGA